MGWPCQHRRPLSWPPIRVPLPPASRRPAIAGGRSGVIGYEPPVAGADLLPGSGRLWLAVLKVAVEEGGQLGFGQGAYFGGIDIAVFEQHQGGNTADVELGRCLFVFVDVQFADLELAFVLVG